VDLRLKMITYYDICIHQKYFWTLNVTYWAGWRSVEINWLVWRE